MWSLASVVGKRAAADELPPGLGCQSLGCLQPVTDLIRELEQSSKGLKQKEAPAPPVGISGCHIPLLFLTQGDVHYQLPCGK